MIPLIISILFGVISSTIKIDTDTYHFQDDIGRDVIFHGVNIVYKMPPYVPDPTNFDIDLSMTDEDIANLKSWGMNLVRLGVLWEAVEVSEGVYNTSYLEQMGDLINRMGQ